MKADAEEALCQTLAHVSTKSNAAGNLAKSLLIIIDVHLNVRHMQDFWASLHIQEEKAKTRIKEALLIEKKKQKTIHVQSNVIDEHLHASDESKIEFIMEASNYDGVDETGYRTPEQQMTLDDEEKESSRYSLSQDAFIADH
ncbi:6961_t:CDS:2 [Paraglomus brasilianum]|uniref:6961_t:CDS:1 n=1 Tax=Paraglomus brasilianum TaxID=144538 RepID=A0A9N9C319_9GLOM|nr:6961_t:CDS:2 [Paraglomus brasilianum]